MNMVQCAPDCLLPDSQHQQKSEVLALFIKLKYFFSWETFVLNQGPLLWKPAPFVVQFTSFSAYTNKHILIQRGNMEGSSNIFTHGLALPHHVVPQGVVLHGGCMTQVHARWPSQMCWVSSQCSAACSQQALIKSGKQKSTQHLSQGGWM